MHDLPSMLLLQQSHAVSKTGADLEVLGKHASHKFLSGECRTLNEAVVSTVKRAGLSPEQVRRVIEFANNDAFLSEHRKEGASKYVEFYGGPASPGEVLRDLNDGGGGTVFDKGTLDYSLPPVHRKVAAYSGPELEKAASFDPAFAVSPYAVASDMADDAFSRYRLPPNMYGFDPFGEQEKKHRVAMLQSMGYKGIKVAEDQLIDGVMDKSYFEEVALAGAFASSEHELPAADPMGPAQAAYDKLAGEYAHLTSELSTLEGAYQDSLADVYEHVKAASLEGVPLGQVMAAWQEVVPDPVYVKVAFQYIGPKLISEGVFTAPELLLDSLEKTAHVGAVNPNHPLVGSMAVLCMTLDKLASVREEREEVAQYRDEMADFMKKTAGPADYLKRVAAEGGLLKKVTDTAARAGKAAGPAVGSAAEVLLGSDSPIAGNLARGTELGITYAPHALGTLGAIMAAEDIRSRLKYNPITNAVGNFVASRIPYTNQNMLLNQERAMRSMYY